MEIIFIQQDHEGVQGQVISSTSPWPSSFLWFALQFLPLISDDAGNFWSSVSNTLEPISHLGINTHHAIAYKGRVISSDSMIRDASKNYTWVCAGSHIASHLLLFRVSLFSHRPEIQTQTLPPVDQVFTCFSWASTFIFPELQGWEGTCFACEKGSSSKRIKVLLSCIWRMVKQGGWLWPWLSWGQRWQRQGRHSPFLSPFLFTFGGASRKLEWLRGRRRRPPLEDISTTVFLLCPLFIPVLLPVVSPDEGSHLIVPYSAALPQ